MKMSNFQILVYNSEEPQWAVQKDRLMASKVEQMNLLEK